MAGTYCDSSVSKLCSGIIHSVKTSNANLKNYNKLLRLICSVSEKSIHNSLTNIEIINCALRVVNVKLNLQEYLETLTIVLDSSIAQSWDVITVIIPKLLLCDVLDIENKKNLILKIWNHRDVSHLPASLVVTLIKEDPVLLEMHFIKLYIKYHKSDETVIREQCWKDKDTICWLNWASQSSQLFSIIVSVMYQIFLYVKVKQCFIYIIGSFLDSLIHLCELMSIDFVQLYPVSCQGLASLLIIEPDYNPCKNYIVRKLKLMKIKEPSETLFLLSNFQNWSKLICDKT